MTSSLTVVTDTCAIFPQTLRDVLLRAAEAGLYRLRWSEEILDELSRNLREERGLTEDQTRHLLTQMRRAFPEATVTGYERLLGRLTNDPKDRHVLAAAVQAGAQVIVTDNLKDFLDEALAPFDIDAQTPDDFLVYLFDRYPDEMFQIVLTVNAARRRPPEPLAGTLDRLAKSAARFVGRLREHPSMAHQLGRGVTQEPSRQIPGQGEHFSPIVFDAGRAIAQASETIRFVQEHPEVAREPTWVHEMAEASEIIRLGEISPRLVEDRYVDQMRSRALPVIEFKAIVSESRPGELLQVAVVDTLQRPDFPEFLRARQSEGTIHGGSEWIIFPNHGCVFLRLVFFQWKIGGQPSAGRLELELTGPSDLTVARAINRQGQIATTARRPTSVAEVQAEGIVWEFPTNTAVETYLNQVIQESAQGTTGTT